jgi:GDP-4-dehydro-6-deoxy-D-mannose reductase
VAGNASARQPTLVTGAAGFAGGFLLERLAGHARLIGWARPESPNGSETPAGAVSVANVEWRPVDITDADAVEKAIAHDRPTRIYHLAGAANVASSFGSAVPHLRVNALGTEHLLSAVRRAGIPCRVVVVTSAQVYAPSADPIGEDAPLVPPSPYGLTKLAQDLVASAAATSGLDVRIARPFNHIGPRQTADFALPSFARQIALIEAGRVPPVIRVGNLDARRDMTDVRDVVDAYVRIMDAGERGRAYNVCSGVAWRIRDLLDKLLALATVPITVETDPARLRPSDMPIMQGDATRLRAELDWSPTRRIEDSLRDILEYWRGRLTQEP